MAYPFGYDNIPTVSGGDIITNTQMNAVANAINSVEQTLGLTPYGDYANVADAIAGKPDVNYAVDTGSANAYVITVSPGPSSYVVGLVVTFVASNTNTGASTINVNSLGTVNITRLGAALIAGDIQANQAYALVYDGTEFQITNPLGSVLPTTQGGTGSNLSAPALGVIIAGNGSNFEELAAGTNGNSLIADSTQTLGVKWGIPHKMSTSTKTSNYSVASTDVYIRVNASSGSVTITLPDATTVGSSSGGNWFMFKRIDGSAHSVTIATTASQTIDGASSYSLSSQYEVLTVMSNGSDWDIIS